MIFVTGAAGVMGLRLVRGLLAQGRRVRALVLPGDPLVGRLERLPCEVVEGDITRPETLRGKLEGVRTVYHLAALILARDPGLYTRVNVHGTGHLLKEAADAAVRHFVYVSSASVVYPRSTPYSRSKQEAERLVRAAPGLAHTIVRPTLVYDEHGGQEFMMFWEQLRKFPVVPFVGQGQAKKSPVHCDDLVAGLLGIADNPAAHGQIYNLCGAEVVTLSELARMLLGRDGRQKRFVHLPVPLCRLLAAILCRVWRGCPLTHSAIAGLTQDANLDWSQAARDLGYAPIGVRQGLERCFALAGVERSFRG